jgi:phenylacetate-coenzyme A ligase PaaK-like adenylate-forming protein
LNRENYFSKILSIKGQEDFQTVALAVFHYQFEKNLIYQQFATSVKRTPDNVREISDIPFLPIEFFKSHKVVAGHGDAQKIFTSSGTTGIETSKHYVYDISLYENVFTNIFEKFYGKISDYTLLALLPSYLERAGSSLIYMAEKLINVTGSADSGFYLHDIEKLFGALQRLQQQKRKTILLGVTYALLDFVAVHQINFHELIVMETGGMKGRRKEMLREEVHQKLCKGFGVTSIHSEYGMTELLSQAYSNGNGIFETPAWMRIVIRDPYDPFVNILQGNGGINIIDLANIDSCAFIATQDIGRIFSGHKFEVLGRFDFSELRGCNLLVD